jgi:hypothetical protein
MSTYEKIASVGIGILLVFVIIFSYHEINESPDTQEPHQSSRFDESLGQDFKIGDFDTVEGEHASGGMEENCEPLQSVIMGALHDIEERLERGNTFEVNEQTLELFCNKNAEVTLSDASGTMLLLQKMPFTRTVPPQDTDADVGTRVRINATVVPKGGPTPTQYTTYGDVLIPDRFLDNATSSGN